MFLIRFGILAAIGIMFLPSGPPAQRDHLANRPQHFCGRYPKTCDASVELFDAFKLKLAYGVTFARQSLETQAIPTNPLASSRSTTPRYAQPQYHGHGDDWRSAARPGGGSYAAGTLRRDERSTEWRR